MDLLHHIYNLALGGELHRSPVKEPQRVLDLGTGTGVWAIDFAEYDMIIINQPSISDGG